MTQPAPIVLIVDDDPDMLDLVADALDRKGYRTMKAWNGEEALQLVAETEPQLVLLDMRMPVMDGWEFAHAFRERFGRRIPIVVVTAAEDSRLRAAEIGANADLGKPFELARLYEVVADTVGTP
jgi:urea transport system substrate-binding protein